MTLRIDPAALDHIRRHGEESYPKEGAGFLLGRDHDGDRVAVRALPQANRAPEASQSRRYEIGPEDVMATENEAEKAGLEVLGIYHSHPDHPPIPSATDLETALPWYSYVITSIDRGRANQSRSWRLSEDRRELFEEDLDVAPPGSLEN
ncbi:MAG: M67 family metallopeptidase [Anaerolineales bacterium]